MRLSTVVVLAGCGRFGFGEVPSNEDDAADPDAAVVTLECDPNPGPDTVALFGFDADLTMDASQQQVATPVGAVATGSSTRCGSGSIELAGGHVRVADSPGFDLDEGSVELFFRAPTPALDQAILSRDANGTTLHGHFTIGLSVEGRLWVRIQRMGDLAMFRCTGPIPADQWMHVGVSFGPPGLRLWLDHVEQTGRFVDLFGSTQDCSLPHTFGIAGNDNVLAIGGSLVLAADADPAPTPVSPFGGSVDHLHVRSTWRDFSRF